MLMKHEKILEYLDRLPIHIVRAAWIARCRAENERVDKLEDSLSKEGFERVVADGIVTEDGREVLTIRSRSYALRKEIHAKRLADSFARSKKQQSVIEAKSVVGTESLSNLACPKCGDALQHTVVCPHCSAGKIGYRHRYICVCGAVDIISKDAL